ncbi:hypothetical protein T459_15054 [Capsicum annuum]|uniref:Tf2-1-like SH3-like domain-containing protein n=1 Tax=Capsicum annuum TaxID=4072 RepID=A0A2G2ZJ60_CAPAN|nr:hypothetical protein T459_15054 [Capsicum annuum]
MKALADKSHTKIIFEVGDWAFVKLQPYRQSTLRLQRDHKLGMRYFGPYKILKCVGVVAYNLDLPEAAKIHSVFHASILKHCVGELVQQITPLQLLDTLSLADQPNPNLEDNVVFQEGSIVVNKRSQVVDQDDTGTATEDNHMDMPRKSSRKEILPKRLDDYVWRGGSSRDKGKSLLQQSE